MGAASRFEYKRQQREIESLHAILIACIECALMLAYKSASNMHMYKHAQKLPLFNSPSCSADATQEDPKQRTYAAGMNHRQFGKHRRPLSRRSYLQLKATPLLPYLRCRRSAGMDIRLSILYLVAGARSYVQIHKID